MSKNSSLRPIIELESVQLLSFSFESPGEFDPSKPLDEVRVGISFAPEVHADDEKLFRVFMEIRLIPRDEAAKNTPYLVSSRVIGYFSGPKQRGGNFDPAILLNALTVLYGALRGMVLQTSGSAAHGPIVLPTIAMYSAVSEYLETLKPPKDVAKSERPSSRRKTTGKAPRKKRTVTTATP